VLVENFRAGAMARLGFGWETLHTRFPRLIYAAASGFGHTGPYAERPAYDMVVQAMGGVMSLTGPEGGPPTRVGTSIGDITAGLFTAIGVGSALYHRERTGEGIQVDVAMLDSQVAILENAIARYTATGEVPGPIGSRHPSITPFAVFATKDGSLVIAAGNDALFRTLCDELECGELALRPEFASNPARTENESRLKPLLERALTTRTTGEWLTRLERAGVPCGPINDVADILRDPQVLARNMIVEAAGPGESPMRMAGNPIKLSGFEDASTREPAPALDADREAILAWLRHGEAGG
jgi:CoA:oxalate CoA-transferase